MAIKRNRMLVNFRTLVLIIIACSLMACAGSPPASQRLSSHSELSGGSGPALLVDVCVNEDVIGDDDYFVVKEAKEGATAIADATERYLQLNGFRLSLKLIPFVCGALHDVQNRPKRVARAVGQVASESP